VNPSKPRHRELLLIIPCGSELKARGWGDGEPRSQSTAIKKRMPLKTSRPVIVARTSGGDGFAA
jgi:hypothetical protein